MTDDSIQAKALALVNKIEREEGENELTRRIMRELIMDEALCRSIEQHEAFRQEVSDIVQDYSDHVDGGYEWNKLMGLITKPKPKPDPLVEAMKEIGVITNASALRAALEARGFEIQEI